MQSGCKLKIIPQFLGANSVIGGGYVRWVNLLFELLRPEIALFNAQVSTIESLDCTLQNFSSFPTQLPSISLSCISHPLQLDRILSSPTEQSMILRLVFTLVRRQVVKGEVVNLSVLNVQEHVPLRAGACKCPQRIQNKADALPPIAINIQVLLLASRRRRRSVSGRSSS